MLNPHPPLSGIPFALITALIIFEFLFFITKDIKYKTTSTLLLYLAVVLISLTYFSGYWGVDHAQGSFSVSVTEIENHKVLALISLFSMCPLLLFGSLRTKFSESNCIYSFYCFFIVLSYLMIIVTSFKGGELVFKHGAGVQVQLE
jgi:uncharacterized membrane protein